MFSVFKRKRKNEERTVKYNPEKQKAVLRCSICTGEQVAGFMDVETGKFEEVMLIRNETDLERFRQQYGIAEITRIY